MATRKLTSSEIDDLIHYLQGTILSLDTALNDMYGVNFMEVDIETLSEIDSHIFNCEGCGWWCDLGEQSLQVDDDMICTDCEDDYIE